MASVDSVKNFAYNLNNSLHERSRLLSEDVLATAERLSKRKEAITNSGLERMQNANAGAAMRSETQRKIDTFA